MLETLAEYFYDPLLFWSAPLVLVALAAAWRQLRRPRSPAARPPENDRGD